MLFNLPLEIRYLTFEWLEICAVSALWFSAHVSEEWMKALVVVSSSTMRSVLRRILSMRGFEVAEAGDGLQALDTFRSMGTVDLVLVDWIPHEAAGLEFITRIRHGAAHDTIVIVLVACELGMRELRRALIVGADHCLTKPFTSLQFDESLAQAGFAWQCGGGCDKRRPDCR